MMQLLQAVSFLIDDVRTDGAAYDGAYMVFVQKRNIKPRITGESCGVIYKK